MQVVIDTNVIISSLINEDGVPSKIMSSAYDGDFFLLYDDRILSEYIKVLYRKKFIKIDRNLLSMIFEFIEKEGIYVPAQSLDTKFTDETDKKFYEVYKSGHADYLITGNKKHFPKEQGIVTPKEFISTLYS